MQVNKIVLKTSVRGDGSSFDFEKDKKGGRSCFYFEGDEREGESLDHCDEVSKLEEGSV